MKNIQVKDLYSSYSEFVNTIKELENEEILSHEESEILIEIFSIFYVTSRLQEITSNFSLRLESKFNTSFENMLDRLASQYEQ